MERVSDPSADTPRTDKITQPSLRERAADGIRAAAMRAPLDVDQLAAIARALDVPRGSDLLEPVAEAGPPAAHAVTIVAESAEWGPAFRVSCLCDEVIQAQYATHAQAAEVGRRHLERAAAEQDVVPTSDMGRSVALGGWGSPPGVLMIMDAASPAAGGWLPATRVRASSAWPSSARRMLALGRPLMILSRLLAGCSGVRVRVRV